MYQPLAQALGCAGRDLDPRSQNFENYGSQPDKAGRLLSDMLFTAAQMKTRRLCPFTSYLGVQDPFGGSKGFS